MCGYGFRDKGVNRAIVGWIESSSERQMVVIHGSPGSLRDQARGAISLRWGDWVRDGKLRLVPSWLEELSPDDLRDAFVECD